MLNVSSRRPYVIVSFAMSLDGALDDTNKNRLILSNEQDFDEVDALRASCDAIAVGANTIRNDNPRLLLHSSKRRVERVKRGLPQNPHKVIFSNSGNVDRSSQAFAEDGTQKFVFDDVALGLAALSEIGVERLLVEGGPALLKAVFSLGFVDEARIAVASTHVNGDGAPRVDLQQAPFFDVLNGLSLSHHDVDGMNVYEYHH